MIKMIAIDLDGTLLNEENKISKKNLEAIRFAQSRGIEVVIATGRAHFDVQEIFKNSELTTWIIGANGATIHQPNGELFRSIPINKQEVINILRWLERENFYYEVFSNHTIFTPQNGRELLAIEIDRIKTANPDVRVEQLKHAAGKQFSQTGFLFITSSQNLVEVEEEFYNILAFSFDDEKLKKGKDYFKQTTDLTVVTSAKHNFELEHKQASKGSAIQLLSNQLNINIKDTAAVGDSFNDLSMLQIAGRSAAMGNAPKEIKAACHEVTLSNAEDGVAHFIYSLL